MSAAAKHDPIMERLARDPAIAGLFASFTKMNRDAEAARAQADPKAHKLTRVMTAGASTGYRYFRAGRDGRGREVRFCRASHRNAAGYFLTWREVVSKAQTKRDQFAARKTRAAAEEVARRRQNAWIDRAEREAAKAEGRTA